MQRWPKTGISGKTSEVETLWVVTCHCFSQSRFLLPESLGSQPISAASKLGYSPASGPGLFDQMALEMSEFVDSITSAAAKRLQKAFRRGYHVSWPPSEGVDENALAPLRTLSANQPIPSDVLIADRVIIDSSSGVCFSAGVSLRLINLEPHQKTRMKDSLIGLVKRQMRSENNQCVDGMLAFWEWLE